MKKELELKLDRKNFNRSCGSFKGEENAVTTTEVGKVINVFRTNVSNLTREYIMNR